MSATVIVGTWYSRCSACGKNAFPSETHHFSSSHKGAGDGCGELFTMIMSEYLGLEDTVKGMRPDLRFLPSPIGRS